jgi:hypothetical protein
LLLSTGAPRLAPPTDSTTSFDGGPSNDGPAQALLRAYTRTKYVPGGTFGTASTSAVLLVSTFARFAVFELLPA